MRHHRGAVSLSILAFAVSVSLPVGTVRAEDISGTFATTKFIFENSRLVGDVECVMADSPCIEFGASNIQLRLNGYTITGTAEPPANCAPNSGPPFVDAIVSVDKENIRILGPGMVQKFRRHGIFLLRNDKITLRHVISHHNCFSGILAALLTNSSIEENVSTRNGIASASIPCGGNCLVNSHGNWIRRNEFTGNGSAVTANAAGSDFGVGLLFGSSGNVVEENGIGGNVNGILIHLNASGNVIRNNVISGNPPAQVAATFGAGVGADIHNQAPAGANTFENNLCMTYIGAGPAPCPNVPKFAGHRNTKNGGGD